MQKKFLEWLNRLGDSHTGEAPLKIHAEFKLYYKDLLIGSLTVLDGKWTFQYSEEFKKQDAIKPIIGFSSIDETYESEELWPFFLIRIPSPQQPRIQEIIEKEQLNEEDNVQMLTRFGKKTIANPFILEPA